MDAADDALTPPEFAALMAPLGPFETRPRVAVAVSGGADSMALALLAADWAASLGGSAAALTVDHGLRAESAAEAQAVGEALRGLGLSHRILAWAGEKPASGIQAAARAARYRLLEDWCRREGVLHLLLAHQLEDQAETVLLRLGAASGVDGLAGMAAVSERPGVRLLRPLLGVSGRRLRALLQARGVAWIEDPSNRKSRFQRVRVRALAPALAEAGMEADRIAASARRLARARAALEIAAADLAARAVFLHPAGFAHLDAEVLAAAPEEIGLRLLGQLLRSIGGNAYPPDQDALERLYGRMGRGEGGTLGGCRVVRRLGERGVLVCRESRGLQGSVPAGREVLWDRFRLGFAANPDGGLAVGALGPDGKAALRADKIPIPAHLPKVVLGTLPAVYDQLGVCAVPHLGYNRTGVEISAEFRPANPLAGAARCLV